MMLRYKPTVANAVIGRFDRANTSGLVAFGPSRFQTIFGNSEDRIEVPSLLEALRLQNRLPANRDPGTSIYCTFRPMILYEETDTGYHVLPNEPQHWLALNGWPCVRQPSWSRRIYVELQLGMLDKHWKIRLLSMSFVLWNSDTREFDEFATPLTFGDGLIVHLDFGTSVTIVPSFIVHHIRTSLFPTDENIARDNGQQDQACDPRHPVLPFTVPGHLGAKVGIRYRFADGKGGEVEILGPGTDFLGQPNPKPSFHRQTKDREGLIFAGSTNLSGDGALFGLNFFQSMFVALHSPLYEDLYVELAPQWDAHRMWFNLTPRAD